MYISGYEAEMERMNQTFYPSCDLYHSPSSLKQQSHPHHLLPPPPLLHHDLSTPFSDDCPLTPIHHHKTTTDTTIFPTSFPEIEDVVHPSDILVLDQPLRKDWTNPTDDYNSPGHPQTADDYIEDDEAMKEDYVVTSLDDPDVSQRFFAAIDNLLLQDYGGGGGEDFGARETEKGGEYRCRFIYCSMLFYRSLYRLELKMLLTLCV